MNTTKGFTLTELIITITLGAIILALAVPSYYSTIQNNRVAAAVNEVSAALHFARMEAIRRGIRVSICPVSVAGGRACGGVNQWAQGWLIFLNPNNTNSVSSTANLLRVHEAFNPSMNIMSNRALVGYDGSGFMTSGTLSMTINAAGCKGNNVRNLNASASGRLSITRDVCS